MTLPKSRTQLINTPILNFNVDPFNTSNPNLVQVDQPRNESNSGIDWENILMGLTSLAGPEISTLASLGYSAYQILK
jgi:hypothetical protein